MSGPVKCNHQGNTVKVEEIVIVHKNYILFNMVNKYMYNYNFFFSNDNPTTRDFVVGYKAFLVMQTCYGNKKMYNF